MIRFDEHIFQRGWNHQLLKHHRCWRCFFLVMGFFEQFLVMDFYGRDMKRGKGPWRVFRYSWDYLGGETSNCFSSNVCPLKLRGDEWPFWLAFFVAKTVAQNHQLVFFQFLHLPKALGSSLWVDHGSLLTWRTTKVACRGGTGMFYHNFPWNSALNHHLLGIFFLGVFFQSFEETNPTTEDDITVHGSEILRQPAGM